MGPSPRSLLHLVVPALLAFLAATAASAQLVISEFRLSGPNGPRDEFIEIQNNSTAPITVASASGSGYGIASSDFALRCVIPNGTVIPARGHFLCANADYSLGSIAAPDATYSFDIADNAGIALFNSTLPIFFSVGNRFDAVGSTSEINAVYKEGSGYSPVSQGLDYAWVRDACGKHGSPTLFGPCPNGGFVADTDNNANDFFFVDSRGPFIVGGHRLGAPGPENLSSPIYDGVSVPAAPLDPCASPISAPNSVRDFTSDPANNATFGTLDLRETFTNNTGVSLTRLRLRVIDLSTYPVSFTPAADLRLRSSSSIAATVDRAPCGTGTSSVTVQGVTLEQANPTELARGGGFNTTLSAGTVTLGTPLANGASIDLRLLFGVEQTGNYKVGLIVEALPRGGSAVVQLSGNTEVVPPSVVSITRLDPNPTDAASVRFLVTFSESVTGVDAGDFALVTGIAGAAITGVTGSGATRTVTVSSGTGVGTIRLDVVDDDTIVDADPTPLGGPGAGNGSFTTGEVYTIVAAIPAIDPRSLALLALALAAVAIAAVRRLP